jgi:hypothetical protein
VASKLAVIQVLRADDDVTPRAVVHRPVRRARPVCPLATMDGMLNCSGEAYPMENNSLLRGTLLPQPVVLW